jgi:hypothetical protein
MYFKIKVKKILTMRSLDSLKMEESSGDIRIQEEEKKSIECDERGQKIHMKIDSKLKKTLVIEKHNNLSDVAKSSSVNNFQPLRPNLSAGQEIELESELNNNVNLTGLNNSINCTSNSKSLNLNMKAMKTLLILLLGFYICWLPLIIYFLTFASQKYNNLTIYILMFIACCNALIDPIVYAFRNKEFCRALLLNFSACHKRF